MEAFFAEGLSPADEDVGPALASFSARALALDHGGLYRGRRLPKDAGVRYFFPSPEAGSACKRLNLYLRWMARRDGVDLGVWRRPDPSQLVLPIDAHTFAIARRVRLTRYRSRGLGDGPRRDAPAPPARPQGPGEVRLRLPPHGLFSRGRTKWTP